MTSGLLFASVWRHDFRKIWQPRSDSALQLAQTRTDLFTGEILGKVRLSRHLLLLLQFPLRHFDVVKFVACKAAQHLI